MSDPAWMQTGYEKEPAPVGRSRSRRLPFAIGGVAIMLAIVIAKPWAGPDQTHEGRTAEPPSAAATHATDAAPSATAQTAAVDIPAPTDPVWPTSTVSPGGATSASTEAEGALPMLHRRGGTWGVGVTGVGPRLIRDEPWYEWTQVDPEVVDGPPAHIAIWPGTDLCTGLPTIYDHPTVVVITMPVGVEAGSRLAGWWTDGGRAASIDDSVLLVASDDASGVASVERLDRAPWPVGRYEFHVESGGRTVALTVCLTRRA
jgi:hypothetical protein